MRCWFFEWWLRLRFAPTLALIASAASSVALAADTDGPTLEGLARLDLPEEVGAAVDVRWQEDGILLLGVGGNGVYSWRIGDQRAALTATLAGSRIGGFGGVQDYSRLGGRSSGVTVFSSNSHGIFLHEEGEVAVPKDVEIVGDLDRRFDRTAVVGLSRTPDREWESRLGWLVSDDGKVRGILPKRFEDSHWLLAAELGVVRFLSDDRVLIVPGLEPDVFVYDWSGQLRDVFETKRFFADNPWEIASQQELLLTEPSYFRAWLSRHRVIDEVVVDGRGNVFFFVRHPVSEMPYPTHINPERPRVTGTITTIDGSDQATSRPLTDEQTAQLMELLDGSGKGESSEPVTISGSGLNEIFADARLPPADPLPPPQRGRVCWDLVHAHMGDLQTVHKSDCVVASEFADARLRADVLGDRVAILIRGDTFALVARVRSSEVFVARVVPSRH